MAPAVAIISAVGALASAAAQAKQAKAQKKAAEAAANAASEAKANALTYDQGMQQARDSMNPIYDQTLLSALGNVDNASINRGFYGQLPADALRRSTAEKVEADRQSAIANLANQMVGQSQSFASQVAQNAISGAQASANIGNNYTNTSSNLLDTLQNMRNAEADRTGQYWTFGDSINPRNWGGGGYSPGSSTSYVAPVTVDNGYTPLMGGYSSMGSGNQNPILPTY